MHILEVPSILDKEVYSIGKKPNLSSLTQVMYLRNCMKMANFDWIRSVVSQGSKCSHKLCTVVLPFNIILFELHPLNVVRAKMGGISLLHSFGCI
jgi:hypothetical protein